MPDPSLRQLLEYARPVRDFAQALQTSLRLIEASLSAEATLGQATARADAASKEAQRLEQSAAKMAEDVAAQRELMLEPVRQDLLRLEGQRDALGRDIEASRRAFDEERGRRTAILRGIDEQAEEAKRRQQEQSVALRQGAKADEDRLKSDLAMIRAQVEEAQRELARLRAEYQAVQHAAAKLAGR